MREKLIELVNNVLKHLPWGEVSSHTAGDVADHLIANGVTIQKWIPFDEIKPKNGQSVLGITTEGEMEVYEFDEKWKTCLDNVVEM